MIELTFEPTIHELRLQTRVTALEKEITNLTWLMVAFAAIQVITIVAVLA